MEPVKRGLADRGLADLGHAVGDVSDRVAQSQEALRLARERVLEGSISKPAKRPLLLAAAALSLALLGVVVTLWRQGPAAPPALWFELDSGRGRVGDWIAADARAVHLRFSEGTRLSLEPGTRMRVTRTDAHGAELLLERGRARSSFESHPRAHWSLRAGPFVIRVTGTAFDTSWDPLREVLLLAVSEGSVLVDGPHLPPGRKVVSGEELHVSLNDRGMSLRNRSAALADAVDVQPGVPAVGNTEPARPHGSGGGSSEDPAASVSEQSDWKEPLRSRRHEQAVSRLEAAGAEREMANATAEELLLLSDAARFAGRPSLARRALRILRERHALQGRTAFLLGKIAAEQEHDPDEAILWFETYLREEPGGPLSEQALGRLMELQRDRVPAVASELARQYLEKHPSGAYAALARTLVAP